MEEINGKYCDFYGWKSEWNGPSKRKQGASFMLFLYLSKGRRHIGIQSS
jgi:hypothetical protein